MARLYILDKTTCAIFKYKLFDSSYIGTSVHLKHFWTEEGLIFKIETDDYPVKVIFYI